MKSNKERYRHFCNAENNLPIFMHDWYLDAVCGNTSWDVVIIEKSGTIAAVLPYYLKEKIGFKYITMPPLTKMLGPYIIEQFKYKEQGIYKELIKKLPKVSFFVQNFNYQNTNWLPFYWSGYDQKTLYSYRLTNFKNLELYFNSIDRYYKKKIAQANEKLVITINNDLNNGTQLSYDLIKKTYKRQNLVMPFNFKTYKNLTAEIDKNNQGKLFLAYDSSQNIVATAYLMWDDTTAYYLIAGDDPKYRALAPGIFLIYKMIEFTSQTLHLDRFDFLGSMISNLAVIRKKFKAEPCPYFEVKKSNSKLFQLLSYLKNI